LREARAAGALRSRHVTRIVDAQTGYVHDGAPLPFLVMELLEGRTLQELLDLEDAGRVGAGQLVWVASQLGRALAAAHERGIVHRDLKPSNVFIARDPENAGQPIVKLCDFGIAKLLGDAPALGSAGGLVTQTGALLGTPMYLAPELLRGARDATPATDQWSLGLVAFRALAGIEYFGHIRGVPALVLAIATERMPPPSELAPHSGFSRAFDGWFLRSCARAPADRFPDVAAQVAALAAALGNPPLAALAPDSDASRSPAHHAAATDPTVAARPAPGTPASTPAGRQSTARLAYIAGATLWALVALGWIATRSNAGDGVPAAGKNSEPKSPEHENPEPSEPAVPPILPVKNPEPTPPPAAKPVAPPAVKKARVPRSAPARLLQRGAPCRRSSDCSSGLCAAETCQ
jgi:eukaryotic-like serine/threonine-protein kinase